MKSTREMTKALLRGGVVLLFVITLVGHAIAQICVEPPAGLISWWPGDGNANDMVDGNDGTLVDGATFAPGMVGQAFSFDGVNDHVLVPDSANLNFGSTDPITLDAWVFRTGTSSIMHILGKRVGCESTGIHYQMALDASGLRFDGDSGGVCGNSGVCTGIIPSLNTWTHIAGTFDGTTFNFYINGVLIATSTGGTLGPANTEPLKIAASGTCGFLWQGLIDEVEIYNRALSPSEIQGIFNAGSAGKCTIQIDIKPGSFPNSINPKSKMVIRVAILTTDTFDATTVDPTTVRFGPTGTEAAPVQSALEDVDGDGDTDMILHFKTQDTGIVCGDISASLTGETFDGQAIRGSDSIKTVGCK